MWRGTARISCRSRRKRRRAASATPASTGRAGIARRVRGRRRGGCAADLLHFGAVDYAADGLGRTASAVGAHEGGYTPFTFDVTRSSAPAASSRSSCAPTTTRRISPSRAASRTGSSSRTRSGIRGRPASGRRSGWRRVPATSLERDPLDAATSSAGKSAFEAGSTASARDGLRLAVTLTAGGTNCSPTTRYAVVAGEVHRRIALSDPGIDDSATSCSGVPTRRP